MILQQFSISLFILSNCYSNFSQIKSYCSSSLNKKIVSDPHFLIFFFSLLSFPRSALSLPFFPSLFSPFLQPSLLSPLLKLRSRPNVECRSRPGVELDLGLGGAPISAWCGVSISTWGGAQSRPGWSADLGLVWSADLGRGGALSAWVERRSRPRVERRSWIGFVWGLFL
jgi:hypothetical protein